MSDREEHGFQWVPGIGPVPLGAAVPNLGDTVSGGSLESVRETFAAVQPEALRSRPTAAPSPSVLAPAFDPSKPITGAQLFAAAKARIKEIDRQLRSVPALQTERAQLAALMQAAKSTRKSRKNVQ